MENDIKLRFKNIPKTTLDNYISGYEALNTYNNKGDVADWHPRTYWVSKFKDSNIKIYKQNEILKDLGIEQRILKFPYEKEVYIANFPRAIVDLLLELDDDRITELYNAPDEFLDDEDKNLLYLYLYKLKHIPKIHEYLKHEFSKRYYDDLYNNKNIKKSILNNLANKFIDPKINVIKEILQLISNNNLILKGDLALALYYNLNRDSYDIELDSKVSYMNIFNTLEKYNLDNNKNWKITIIKNSPKMLKISIDINVKHVIDNLELRIFNVSKYNVDPTSYESINGLNVYNLNIIINEKCSKFLITDNIVDLYDLIYYMNITPNIFTIDNIKTIRNKLKYTNIENITYRLKHYFKESRLMNEKDLISKFRENIDSLFINI